jgi:hypothetical protein
VYERHFVEARVARLERECRVRERCVADALSRGSQPLGTLGVTGRRQVLVEQVVIRQAEFRSLC